jgi:hypothetical protein
VLELGGRNELRVSGDIPDHDQSVVNGHHGDYPRPPWAHRLQLVGCGGHAIPERRGSERRRPHNVPETRRRSVARRGFEPLTSLPSKGPGQEKGLADSSRTNETGIKPKRVSDNRPND